MTSERKIYQQSCIISDCGRNVSKTKRCVKWKFGFVDIDALNEGLIGHDCCGDEHEIKLIWSITSGKQRIYLDKNEIHSSKTRFNERQKGEFHYRWKCFELELSFEIHAYASPPIRQKENWRQFDLKINGLSFYDHVEVFQIGTILSSVCNSPSEMIDDVSISNVIDLRMSDKSSHEITSSDESFDFQPDFESNFHNYDEYSINTASQEQSLDSEYCSDDESEDDNISTTSALLNSREKSDDSRKDDVQMNPNEPPTYEALTKSITCNKEDLDDTQSVSYDGIWGNIFDPFHRQKPNPIELSKQEITTVESCTPKTSVNLNSNTRKNYNRKSFLSPCLLSFAKPTRIRRREEGVKSVIQSTYEEMEGQHEPVF